MLSLIAAVSFLGARSGGAAGAQASADFLKWGEETLDTIQRTYWLPDRSLYAEELPAKQPAFDWGVGVMIPALTAAAKADPAQYRAMLTRYLDSSRIYWNDAGPVPGYDVLPMPKPKDRYYDDNEWMAIDLAVAAATLEADKADREPAHGSALQRSLARESVREEAVLPAEDKYLRDAKATFKFIESGWDEKLGGGIYWRESDKASKNTCSNAPATVAAIDLFRETDDGQYLAFAIKDYAWTHDHLRDPSDGLYFDSMSLDGNLGKAKWSYNSAMMLRAAALLYLVTNVLQYAKDVREIQAASLKHWIADDGAFKDDGKFAFLMIGAWLVAKRAVPDAADPLPAIEKALQIVHERCRDKDGQYGNRWDRAAPADGWPKPMLIDQAAVATADFAVAAALSQPGPGK